MSSTSFVELLGPAIGSALEAKGFTELTPVQQAVLDVPSDKDLRITSQTGSGKTIAIGIVLRELLQRKEVGGLETGYSPRALIITPTRELAKQVEKELAWLFAKIPIRTASVTGGESFRDEQRVLQTKPKVVVGTPGRILDHLKRKSFLLEECGAIVLDEADRMLDMGFKEDLAAIVENATGEHRTHMVSATFAREVKRLADKIQDDPMHIEGTTLGKANVDIDHVIHLVHKDERLSAMVNLLLAAGDERVLIFARMRIDVSEIAEKLSEAGFAVCMLSGEMEQRARDKALAAFKRGESTVLVATDVAARGIDVENITRVIHAEPPDDPDTYTHRSGRTGRAGKKGVSAMLVTPASVRKGRSILERAQLRFRFEPIPDGNTLLADRRQAVFKELTEPVEGEVISEVEEELLEWIVSSDAQEVALRRLLRKALQKNGPEPRSVRNLTPQGEDPRDRSRFGEKTRSKFTRDDRDTWRKQDDDRRAKFQPPARSAPRGERADRVDTSRIPDTDRPSRRSAPERRSVGEMERAARKSTRDLPEDVPSAPSLGVVRAKDAAAPKAVPADRPSRKIPADRSSANIVADRPSRKSVADRPSAGGIADRPSAGLLADRPSKRSRPSEDALPKPERARKPRDADSEDTFDSDEPREKSRRSPSPPGSGVPFVVTWGSIHGADSRRVLAMLCRRGDVQGHDIGSIRVGPVSTIVEIAPGVAKSFEQNVQAPDERNPRVRVRRALPEDRNREDNGDTRRSEGSRGEGSRSGSRGDDRPREDRGSREPRSSGSPYVDRRPVSHHRPSPSGYTHRVGNDRPAPRRDDGDRPRFQGDSPRGAPGGRSDRDAPRGRPDAPRGRPGDKPGGGKPPFRPDHKKKKPFGKSNPNKGKPKKK